MAKYAPKTHERPADAPPSQLPAGKWLCVRLVRENDVRGYVLEELMPDLTVRRIHGPDLLPIVEHKLSLEAI